MAGYSQVRLLAQGTLAGAASSLTLGSFDATPMLRVFVRISGYSASAIAQLQFNGDTGTTAYAYKVSTDLAVPTSAIAATAAGIKVSQTATTGARGLIEFSISNISGNPHAIVYQSSDLSESAATAPSITSGAGVWTNTAQITRITLDGGGANLNAGTWMAVYGFEGF